MALTVTMPQLGESVTEGTIARWLKQPGDAIAKYELIAEVITDKVNAEIPAPADGVMSELIAAEGTVVPVGQPICSIDTGAAAGASVGEGVGTSAPAPPLATSPPQTPQPPLSAPELRSARRRRLPRRQRRRRRQPRSRLGRRLRLLRFRMRSPGRLLQLAAKGTTAVRLLLLLLLRLPARLPVGTARDIT